MLLYLFIIDIMRIFVGISISSATPGPATIVTIEVVAVRAHVPDVWLGLTWDGVQTLFYRTFISFF